MKSYTTAQIAKIMNVHPNTVILYEKWGHIEEVKRKPNGYRVFTERHLEQMSLARMLIKGDIIKIETIKRHRINQRCSHLVTTPKVSE